MLDYKDIITKHYALGMSGKAIAESLKVSVSGVNDFVLSLIHISEPTRRGVIEYGVLCL